MKNDVKQRTVDVQVISHVIIDKAEFPEPVHEEADPRARRADHLRQRLLTQSRNRHFGHSFLAKLCHQQKNSRQTLFAGIEKLIHQVVLISDVPLQQVLDKHGRQFRFAAHRQHHSLPLDMQKDAVCHCDRRRHTVKLTGQTTFSDKIAFAQNAKGCFFAGLRHHAELHLACLDKKYPVRRITLGKDRLFLVKRTQYFQSLKERRGN